MREKHLTGYWCLPFMVYIHPFILNKRFFESQSPVSVWTSIIGVTILTAAMYAKKLHLEFGAHGARETPVPMPNTEVKPRSGYNTWGPPLGK